VEERSADEDLVKPASLFTMTAVRSREIHKDKRRTNRKDRFNSDSMRSRNSSFASVANIADLSSSDDVVVSPLDFISLHFKLILFIFCMLSIDYTCEIRLPYR
jgi:hypothetical protein